MRTMPLVFAAILLGLCFPIAAAFAAGFGVEDNRVTIRTDALPYSPAVGIDGVAEAVSYMQGTSLSRIEIGLVNDQVQPGSYNVELGIVVDDADNMRRIEAYLSGVAVQVAGAATTVSIPAESFVQLVARSGDGGTLVSTTVNNAGADGPVTAQGNTIELNLTNLQNKITQQFGAATTITTQGRYTFSILVKSTVAVGYLSGGAVTPFPSYDVGPGSTQAGLNLAVIPGSPIASQSFLNGTCYAIRGSFGIGAGNVAPGPGDPPVANTAGGGGGGGGGGTTPGVITDGSTVTTDTSNSGNVNGISLGSGTIISNTGVINGVNLGEGASIQGGTVSGAIVGQGSGAEITNAVIDATSITNVTIGSGCRVTQETVTNLNNAGLSVDLTEAVRNAGGVLSADSPILVDETGVERTVGGLIASAVNALTSDTTSTTRTDSDGTVILSAQSLQGVMVPAKITRVETTNAPDGIVITDTGELLIIQNGIATTLAPDSYDSTSFEAALGAGGASTQTNQNGTVIVDLPGGIRVALRFGNFGIAPAAGTASLAQAQAVFSVVGNPSDAENIGLQVTYPDGTTQGLPPFLHDLNGFKGLLDASGIACRFNPANGVFELKDPAGNTWYRGRPDYFMDPAPVGTSGLTVEVAGDVNSDGLVDFYLITPAGRQIIHTLPLN